VVPTALEADVACFGQASRVVLVVDDDSSHRWMLGEALRAAQFDVIEAEDGGEALEQVSRQAVDLVISEVQMPHMDGLTLLDRLRDTRPELPVFLVSGHAALRRESILERGASGFFEKPFAIRELVNRVAAQLL
jgi:DNA-binding response OmpR family regulator